MRHRKDLSGMERFLSDLWIGALQIVAAIALVCLLIGVVVGKWLL